MNVQNISMCYGRMYSQNEERKEGYQDPLKSPEDQAAQ